MSALTCPAFNQTTCKHLNLNQMHRILGATAGEGVLTAVLAVAKARNGARLVAAAAFTITMLLVALHSLVNYCWVTQACGVLTAPANNYGYLLNLNAENNIPAWYAEALLLLVAVVIVPIALHCRHHGDRAAPWWGLCAIFSYLSLDESSDLHGLWAAGIGHPEVFGFSQQYFAWVVPGSIIVMVVVILYVHWVFGLPARTRNLVVTAGIAYVGGGIVLEIIGGHLADATYLNPSYLVASTIEELLEMLGAVIMLYAMLDHANRMRVSFRF